MEKIESKHLSAGSKQAVTAVFNGS